MKKRLFLLPLVAGLTLTGCDFFSNLFGKKSSKGPLDELGESVLWEYGGYEVCDKAEDGGEYLLGVYRKNEDLIRFFNGDYHRDSAGYYPFYMGTVGATTSGAATVKVKYEKGDKFSLQVSAPNKPWDGKYIGFYPAKAAKNYVISIALLDDPNQKSYDTIPNHQNTVSEQKDCYGLFTWFDYYDERPVAAPGITLFHPNTDEEAVPKFMGTGHEKSEDKPEYTSIDAASFEKALDNEEYDLMHLYRKK